MIRNFLYKLRQKTCVHEWKSCCAKHTYVVRCRKCKIYPKTVRVIDIFEATTYHANQKLENELAKGFFEDESQRPDLPIKEV